MKLAEVQDDTLAAALVRCGWQPAQGTTGGFALRDAGARLKPCGLRGDWETYALSSKTLAPPRPDGWLGANGRLLGPVKWVVRGARPPICRADVPRHWPAAGKGGVDGFASTSRSFQADGDGLERPSCDHEGNGLERLSYDRATWGGPRQAWAAAITDFVRQAAGAPTTPLPWSSLAEQLQQAGCAVTLDGQRLSVHLTLPGLYQEIRVEGYGSGHLRVSAAMVGLAGLSSESRRAIDALAAEANTRLPLVRYAIAAETQEETLGAEVCLSTDCALVPGGWLPTAVEVVEAAVTLSAREMQALRDPGLANLVLAAHAANGRKEV